MDGQVAMQSSLQELVQATAAVQRARSRDALIVRPSGDGMALLFLDSVRSPLEAALELHQAVALQARALRAKVGAPYLLRMGIHSGPVRVLSDLNDQTDVAGDGIVIAQRVMDCGDAGHILVSELVARLLCDEPFFARCLHDLGPCEVKHGTLVHLYNLYGNDDRGTTFGNEAVPRKVHDSRIAFRKRSARDTVLARSDTVAAWRRSALNALGLLVGGCAFAFAIGGIAASMLHDDLCRDGAAPQRGAFFDMVCRVPKLPRVPSARASASPAPVRVPSVPSPAADRLASPLAPTASPSVVRRAGGTQGPQASVDPWVVVPSLDRLSVEAAGRRLEAVGLAFDPRQGGVDPEYDSGTIRQQRPRAGTRVKVDTPVIGWIVSSPTILEPKSTANAYTGVVVDATTVEAFRQSGATVIRSADGERFYAHFDPQDTDNGESLSGCAEGMAGCGKIRHTTDGRAGAIAGNRPLRVRAQSATDGGAGLMLDETDARRWREASLRDGYTVVIVRR
jgi:hypothetical protein